MRLKAIAIVVCVAALLSSAAQAQTFVYTDNNTSPNNTVSGYRVNTNGTLTSIGVFPTNGQGTGGGYFASNRARVCGTRLFVSNDASSSVTSFDINPTSGSLTRIGTFGTGGSAGNGISLECTPDDAFLIVANDGSNNLTVFSITSSGSLIPVAGSPFPTGGSGADGVRVTPDGRFLAVALFNNDRIGVYSIGPSGSLAPVPGSPFQSPASGSVAGVDIDPTSRFLYAAQANSGGTNLDVFQIGSGGSLTLIQTSNNPGYGSNSNVAVLNRFLFVSNQDSKSVMVFSVGTDGRVTRLPANPYGVGSQGQYASGLGTNVEGTFLFVASYPNTLASLAINANGSLSPPISEINTGQSTGLESLAVYPARGLRPSIFVNPAAGPYQGTITLSATLTLNGTAISARQITFALNGNAVGSALTNSSGTASVTASLGSLTPGMYEDYIRASFAGDGAYLAVDGTADLSVTKIAPTITWPPPAPIAYGTPLSGAQLNASASTSGTFSYSPAASTVLPAGTHTLTLQFTPNDPNVYLDVTTSRQLTVNKANTQTALAVSPAALGGAWAAQAQMPTARNGAATAVVDGLIYVTGGWNSFHRTAVEAYDPTTNKWSARPDRPYPGQTNGAVGVIGGTMYIAGGTDCCVEVSTLYAYTPATNTWTARASMPTTRQLAAGGVIDGVFYVAGGLNSVGSGPHGTFGTLEAYDPTSNTWTTKATMPTARSAAAGVVLDNKFYVLGGHDGASYLSTLEVYDPATNSWATKAPLPTPRGNLAAAAVGNRLFAIGGVTTGGVRVATVDVYDIATNTWTTAPSLNEARAHEGATVVNDTIYAIGGTTTASPAATGAVERYTPQTASVYGQTITLTATVTGSVVTDGTVTFKDGPTVLGSAVALDGSGQASLAISMLEVGGHALTAEYSGSSNYHASTSPPASHTVAKANTTTSVTSSVNPSTYGQSVTFTATVSAVAPGSGTPGGTITFREGSTVLAGPLALNATGQASFSTTSLSVATHSITAEYGGDSSFNASTSNAISQMVDKASSTTTLVSSPNPSTFGQSVTLTATLSSAVGTPSGTIIFKDGENTVGTASMNASGQATFSTTSLSAGTHSITTEYAGDSIFNASTSDAVSQVVKKAPLTVTADNKSKTYGDANPAFTASYSGFVLGQDPSVLGGTLSFTTPATASSDVGTYAITPDGLTASNYAITFANGTLTINKAPLTVTADSTSKAYGDANPAFTASYSGFVLGQDPSVLGGALAFTTPATASSDVGTYVINPGGLTSGNYAITFVNGTLTINQTPLMVTADNKSKAYGDANPAFTASYSGFVLGQAPSVLGGTLALTTPATASSDVGTYTITPGGLTSGNYAITFVNGTLTINQTPLMVTADNKSKAYGDANPAFTASYSGFVLGQDPSVLGGTLALTTPATASSDVGTYAITPGGLTASNYAISFVNGTLAINKAPLTVTADNKSKTYGDVNPAFTTSYSGFVLGQDPSVLGGMLAFTTPAAASSDVGTYAITPGGLTSSNYAITFVNGTLRVNTAPLTVRADDKSRLYGAGNPKFTASYSGFVLGQDPSVLGGMLTFTTQATAASDVGTYPIIPGGLTSSNYELTFVNGTLAIEKRLTTVSVAFASSPVDEAAITQVTFIVTDGSGPASTDVDVRPKGVINLTEMVRFASTGGPLAPNAAACTLTPATPGVSSCTITVTAIDNPDATIAVSFAGDTAHTGSQGRGTVVVNNVAPTITSVAGPAGPLALGSTATVALDFTDPGSADTHTCTFSWDDGSTTTVTPSGTGDGSCSAPHTYTAASVYTVGVEVTDKDAGKATRTYEFVVVYDPTGGFVTGGGWINSPVNAYLADPSLTGKANFGFVSKYQKGATVPTGQTEFQFQVGNLNFHSTVYEWLVVSGAKAQYKGSGTINGSGDYGFLLTATDGQQNDGGGVDKFRIKIWDMATGAVVYDNKRGASDDIDNTDPQAISGGSIVIHKQ